MKYIMYHKSLPTVTFSMDEKGFVDKIYSVENEAHVHPFLLSEGKIDASDSWYSMQDKLLRWMADRYIPASRKNLSSALASLGVKSSAELAMKSFFLSLSDHYWIAPSDLKIDWGQINFYANGFSKDVGDALFGAPPKGENLNLRSPDPSTNGQLVKKWIIENGRRLLIKGGSGPEQLEPFNEVLASEICSRLGLNSVKYELLFERRNHYCVCENFTNETTECVTAGELCDDLARFEDDFVSYEKFKQRCAAMKIPLNEIELGRMFVLDYIIANEDRHLNNFGFMRDSETLEWKGLCPIFDSGSSMFRNYSHLELEECDVGLNSSNVGAQCKPFSRNHIKQLLLFPLATCLNGLPLEKLFDIGVFYGNLLAKNLRGVSQQKIEILSRVLQNRVEVLRTLRDARSADNLDVTKAFQNALHEADKRAPFAAALASAHEKSLEGSDKKFELLSFYLYGLNSKSKTDLERKLGKYIKRQDILFLHSK